MSGKIMEWIRAYRYVKSASVALFLPLALLTSGCADSSVSTPPRESIGSVQQPVELAPTFSLALPSRMSPQRVALGAADALHIADRAQVLEGANISARVVNTGTGSTQLGADSKVGSTWTGGGASLASRARVEGDLVAAGAVVKQQDAVVTGLTRQQTAITPFKVSTWTPTLPPQTGGDASLEPDRQRTLTPGGYGNAFIKSRSTLRLSAGTYLFENMGFEPQSKLQIDDTQGPVVIYVRQGFMFRGSVDDAGVQPDEEVELLVTIQGSTQVTVEAPFKGTVFAPAASVYLGPLNGAAHFGAFFGKSVQVEAGTIINHRAFPWTSILPPEVVSWSDAPVILRPFLGTNGSSPISEVTPAAPVEFTIPDSLWVSSGNAGNGTVELSFRQPNGTIAVCTYRGRSSVAHPVTDLERAKGRRYVLMSCTGGFSAGGSAIGTWFKLRLVGADPTLPETMVEAHLGRGCSGPLAPPMSPEEVVAMRENFDWRTVDALAEIDPQGFPALWHGVVYIERKEQLEALDRWRVKWSALPFSETYVEKYADSCGRMQHAGDGGQGVVVYAIFPAKLFNMLRNIGIETALAGVPAPFRVIVPSTPDAPEHMNADGSLKYSALASSGYADWLAAVGPQAPGLLGDIGDWLSETGGDIAEWTNDNIIDPATEAGEDGFGYIGSLWDTFVDWTANAIDDVWETIQEGLGSFIGLFAPEVTVTVNVQVQNRDVLLGGQMVRGWGRPHLDGERRAIVPHGAMARIRQWGFGMLPVMAEDEISSLGRVEIEALKAHEGRYKNTFCIEMDSDDGSITTDLIPNEVCSFDSLDFNGFQHDTAHDLKTTQADLHAFTQIIDGADFARTVMLYTPRHAQVLTGFLANTMTSIINGGEERAMALCLDFPSVSSTSLTLLSQAVLGLAVTPLIQKDIWWPDVGAAVESRVMTHEYGHFMMCDLLYDASGPSALTPLIARIGEGQNDSRDDTIAITTEAFADVFSMQVMGGANYIRSDGALSGKVKYCQAGGSCLDFNYKGNNDFNPTDGFYDELARVESIMQDVFDRHDSAWRDRDQPWNGDVWGAPNASGVRPVAAAPFITNADEMVSLSGGDWNNFIGHWVANSGPIVSPQGMLDALNETMKERTFNWCQRCEVFALHDKDTPGVAGSAVTDGAATPFDRWRRWKACVDAEVEFFDDTAPEPKGNISPSCTACPNLQFANYATGTGACTPCPAGWVAAGDRCNECPPGTVPGPNNECVNCPPYEISVAGVCTPCRFGEGADRATNTCVECPADAALDLSAVTLPQCNQGSFDLIPASPEPANDICPQTLWLEINNLSALAPKDRHLTVISLPEDYLSGGISQSECPLYAAHVFAYRPTPPGDAAAWQLFDQSGGLGSWQPCNDPLRCINLPGPTCVFPSELTFTTAQMTSLGNRLRFRADGAFPERTLARLRAVVSRIDDVGCDPE